MEATESFFSDIVEKFRSWIPSRADTSSMPRDFWMPDQSCRVCYDCESPFNLFNRRHHCRVCGRVFCGKCTLNTLPIVDAEEGERVRVCNFCHKLKQEEVKQENAQTKAKSSAPTLTPSSSSFSLASSNASGVSTTSSSGNLFQPTPHGFRVGRSGPLKEKHPCVAQSRQGSVTSLSPKARELSPNPYDFCSNRSDDDETDDTSDAAYHDKRLFEAQNLEEDCDSCTEMGLADVSSRCSSVDFNQKFDSDCIDGSNGTRQENTARMARNLSKRATMSSDDYEGLEESIDESNFYTPSLMQEAVPVIRGESVDMENNDLLWAPPPPEDEDDELAIMIVGDDDEDDENGWGSLSSSAYRSQEKSAASDEQRRAMRAVVEGHFRALVAQLLEGEGLKADDSKGSWLEVVTALASEAASLIKPDTSKNAGMDPAGYVKVKCIAAGRRSESCVVKGVVCKRNVAHRRMPSCYKNPRLLLLGGALEYQRVSNQFSSLDTLLQQEKEYLSMAVSRIEAHHPNVVIVEKTVARQAQETLLAKQITLVLNVKRPLLERIARCTGAEIVAAPDRLIKSKCGHCELFHVEKVLEDLGDVSQGGKKATKLLMFFEGCSRPLGCTVLLKGSNIDQLKRVKRTVQYAIFAAYQLALETSFLVDEGATVPDSPFKSPPLSVALPEKQSKHDRSITTIPGFFPPVSGKSLQNSQQPPSRDTKQSWNDMDTKISGIPVSTSSMAYGASKTYFPHGIPQGIVPDAFSNTRSAPPLSLKDSSSELDGLNMPRLVKVESEISIGQDSQIEASIEAQDGLFWEEQDTSHEDFPPPPSDHQSILVSFSSSCLRKGTVCVRGHVYRIRYYGSFDKPLGRFLRDNVFDVNNGCGYCEETRDAHIHCYMHRQGSLTISVRHQNQILTGESEGKIWMWHRCLKCPHTSTVPPATPRILMSDAAWGLSFGKFLELSFSNHAAASRIAACGHSLHRDCLRFYGFGSMVACFRYAPINVYSVFLPPPKLEFNNPALDDWLLKEVREVTDNGKLIFAKAYSALHQIEEKLAGYRTGLVAEAKTRLTEYEAALRVDQEAFVEILQKAAPTPIGLKPLIADILELNLARQRLAFLSVKWNRLFHRLLVLFRLQKIGIMSKSINLKDPPAPSASIESKEVFGDKTSWASEKSKSCNSILYDTFQSLNGVHVQGSNFSCETDVSVHRVATLLKGADAEEKVNCTNDLVLNDHNCSTITHNSSQVTCERVSHVEDLLGTVEGKHTVGLEGSVTVGSDGVEFAKSTDLDSKIAEYKITLCQNVLEDEILVQRALLEDRFPRLPDLSDTFEAAWTGKVQVVEAHTVNITASGQEIHSHSNLSDKFAVGEETGACTDISPEVESHPRHNFTPLIKCSSDFDTVNALSSPGKVMNKADDLGAWIGTPFSNLYRSYSKGSRNSLAGSSGLSSRIDSDVTSCIILPGEEARVFLPLGINDTVIPVYDDEPTSVIAYAITSHQYQAHILDRTEIDKEERRGGRDGSNDVGISSRQLVLSHPLLFVDGLSEQVGFASRDKTNQPDDFIQASLKESRSFQFSKATHVKVSFRDDGPQGRAKYTVTCYYARQFDALRNKCCPGQMEFIRSLCRCKKWGAQGGKSNVFFAKTADDRFVIKQVTKIELESFIKFAPQYFKYLSDAVTTGSPTCLAKILGIFQVTIKPGRSGKEARMDLMVMENLLYGRHVNRLYDLKGSLRSRYNADTTGKNKVLLDQNLLESMLTNPIFIGNKAKRILERAVWNDTSFLASADVMDYSLLVGVDEERKELVLGIIDFLRQYTWDKHLETWVKASGILGGPKHAAPTVISPKQYKKRFRKAMKTYFLMVPDQWSPSTELYAPSLTDPVTVESCSKSSQTKKSEEDEVL